MTEQNYTTLTIYDIHSLTLDRQKFIKFLLDRRLLPRQMACENCQQPCLFNADTVMFRCFRQRTILDSGRRKRKLRCNFRRSARTATWFQNAKLSMEKCLQFISLFLLCSHPRTQLLCFNLAMSRKSVIDWSSSCREVCVSWALQSSQRIGGVGKIVEIVEIKMVKTPHNRGRIEQENWVFGGLERGFKNFFIKPVPACDSANLLEVIKDWILPGTTVISNCWSTYDCLEDEGYRHLKVNNDLKFVDPNTGLHTQDGEGMWRIVRAGIPLYGRSGDFFLSYFSEYLFKRTFPHSTRVSAFLHHISELYATEQ